MRLVECGPGSRGDAGPDRPVVDRPADGHVSVEKRQHAGVERVVPAASARSLNPLPCDVMKVRIFSAPAAAGDSTMSTITSASAIGRSALPIA